MKKRCTFDNYSCCDENMNAYRALLNMAAMPAFDRAGVPLFINGPVGVGKTHLLFALQNYLNASAKMVQYLPCNEFISMLVCAIQTRQTEKFFASFEGMQYILIDDVQVRSGKYATAEELLMCTQRLNKIQFILAGSFVGEEKNLFSHKLEKYGGVVLEIQSPSEVAKQKILRRYINRLNLDLPEQVLVKMAASKKNIRQLEGCVNSIFARHLVGQNTMCAYNDSLV